MCSAQVGSTATTPAGSDCPGCRALGTIAGPRGGPGWTACWPHIVPGATCGGLGSRGGRVSRPGNCCLPSTVAGARGPPSVVGVLLPLQNAGRPGWRAPEDPPKRIPRPMISQGTPGAKMLTIFLLGSISSSPKLYPNQSERGFARPMVSQGTQKLAGMGNSQAVLACHCIARLFFRDLFHGRRCTKP